MVRQKILVRAKRGRRQNPSLDLEAFKRNNFSSLPVPFELMLY